MKAYNAPRTLRSVMFDYRANAEDVAQDLEDAERTSRCPACLDRLFDVKAILQDGRKSLRGTSPKLRSSSAGEQPEVVAPRIPRGNGTVARIGMTDDINQHPRAPPSFGALVRTASAAAAVLFTDYHRLPPVAVPG